MRSAAETSSEHKENNMRAVIRARGCTTTLLIALLLIGVGTGDAMAARVLYVATNGSDSNDGSSTSTPLATLQKANDKVDFAQGHHTIYVRGGTYYGQRVRWSKHSDQNNVTIAAYKNENPKFDGIKNGVIQQHFLALVGGTNKRSNVTIRGLTIRNYRQWGIIIGLSGDWLGGNVIEDNVFQNIGDRFLPPPLQCSSTTRGFAVIAIEQSGDNIVRNNIMVNAENCPANARFMHAVYLQHGGSNNQVYGNYVSITSGDPFKVRNGSSYNHFYDNYVTRSGDRAFLLSCSEAGESSSWENVIENNVITFPYPAVSSIVLTWNCNSIPTTFIDRSQKFFYDRKSAERFGAMVSGDFRGNGQNELVVALNYAGFAMVVRTDRGSKPRTNRYLSKVVHVANHSIHAMTAGDYNGDGKDEMLTLRRANTRRGVRASVTQGNPLDGIGQTIYADTAWDILAMVSGDFDGMGPDEVITSFLERSTGQNYLRRGDGLASLDNFGTIYSNTAWRVTSMTSGDFNGDGRDQLVSALHTPSMSHSRLSRGNGTTSATNFGDLYSSSTFTIKAVAGGYFASTASPTLITALWRKSDGFMNVYHHGYGTNPTAGANIHASLWDVVALDSGQYHTSAVEEVVAAFQNNIGSEVHPGDGTTKLHSYGTFHKWEWP